MSRYQPVMYSRHDPTMVSVSDFFISVCSRCTSRRLAGIRLTNSKTYGIAIPEFIFLFIIYFFYVSCLSHGDISQGKNDVQGSFCPKMKPTPCTRSRSWTLADCFKKSLILDAFAALRMGLLSG